MPGAGGRTQIVASLSVASGGWRQKAAAGFQNFGKVWAIFHCIGDADSAAAAAAAVGKTWGAWGREGGWGGMLMIIILFSKAVQRSPILPCSLIVVY